MSEGWLLAGRNPHSCLCLAGGEWCADRAHEGCSQAQSHADVRGEPSDCCLSGSVFCVHTLSGESRPFLLAHLSLLFFLTVALGHYCHKRGSFIFKPLGYLLVFSFWIPTDSDPILKQDWQVRSCCLDSHRARQCSSTPGRSLISRMGIPLSLPTGLRSSWLAPKGL